MRPSMSWIRAKCFDWIPDGNKPAYVPLSCYEMRSVRKPERIIATFFFVLALFFLLGAVVWMAARWH